MALPPFFGKWALPKQAAPRKIKLLQLGADECSHTGQSLGQLGSILAAAHGGVGLAAAGAAAGCGNFLNEHAGLDGKRKSGFMRQSA